MFDHFSTLYMKGLKQKYIRYNSTPFMNRTLRKAIMTRSKLKRRYNWYLINFENYKEQRNICVNLLRKSKKQYFKNIDVKNVTDNKKFWKTMTPKFSNKCKTTIIIILIENEKILLDNKVLANTFNNYFTDVTNCLGLKKKTLDLRILSTSSWKFLIFVQGN